MRSDVGWIVGCIFAACLLGIDIALHAWGAIEIRSDPKVSAALTFIGAIWLLCSFRVFPWLGLSFSYDVVDGQNVAAVIAISGATVAVALLYTGGNIGEGPSYLENFFSAGLGTAALFVFWFFLEASSGVSASITEERDPASGLRLAGLLVAAGLILGRATAGNWVSVSATLRDFVHDGWPAAVLFVITILVESFTRPSKSRPFPSRIVCGALPALFYLSAAGVWLWHLGKWEGMPQ